MQKKSQLNGLLLLFFLTAAVFGQEARLLRQPHINNEKIAFVYAGDIWLVSSEGGQARKLTSHEGLELFPIFSPDGNWIAFSGEYSGTRQIYLIPSEGGQPRQLTFYPDVGQMPPRGGWDNIPIDWSPDGKKILIRSNRTPYGQRISRYFWVDPFHESLETPLQIPEGGPASLSPDGKKLAYSIQSREFRTWKRYKAGRAQDIWIYDLEANTIEKITDFPGTDNFPLWVDGTIYFTSDRKSVDSDEPRTLNLFAYDTETKTMRQVTNFTEFDCLWPNRGQGGIVFENGGYVYHLDPQTDEIRKLTIILNDDLPHALAEYKKVSEFVESFIISPSGKRSLFSARGDIFSVPEKNGDIRNLTITGSVRELGVDWSPDGKTISYLSEASGDYELFLKGHKSDKPARQATKNTGAWITGYEWSPDSKKIALNDKKHRIRILDVASGKITEVDRGVYEPIGSFGWSPDSKWLVYTKDAENHLTSIWLYPLDQGKPVQLSSDRQNDWNPVFDPDGNYLYFTSPRDFDYQNRRFKTQLFVATLKADLPSPLLPKSDEEEIKTDKEEEKSDKKGDSKEKKAAEEKPPIQIDIKGFDERIQTLPVPAGGYRNLQAVKGSILYIRDNNLYKFDMENREEKQILANVRTYRIAAGGGKLIYQSGNDYGIADIKPDLAPGTGKLDLSGLTMKIDPEVEWRQIYTDAWRIMRDWFYDPHMHGVDWKAMHDKYLPLVDYIGHRTDLDYILGELIGELNSGHTYVFDSPDMPAVDRIDVGVLGCELIPDGKYYKIGNIFPGQNWDNNLRSPLTETGVDVKSGDYILEIDGNNVTTDMNPYRFLENKTNREVTLRINSKPDKNGSREIKIRPISSEQAIRHLAWIKRNRALVDQLSGGRIGYIYVPNTAFAGFKSFFQGFREQFTKDGLIIDERYNGGGHLPADMIFEMSHPVLQYWAQRNLDLQSTPLPVHEGPKVMLINGRASSGGDAFPAYFRKMKLGPLIGQTTWGGLIGYGYSPAFVDNGRMAVPSSAFVNTEGEWDVEYYGVEPDIEVFDDPTLIQAGREPMLEKAVEYILKELKKNPAKKITMPKYPDRN